VLSTCCLGDALTSLNACNCLQPVVGPTVPCVSSITPYQQDLVLINAFSLHVYYLLSILQSPRASTIEGGTVTIIRRTPMPCDHQYQSPHSKHLSRNIRLPSDDHRYLGLHSSTSATTRGHNSSTIWSVGYMEKYRVGQTVNSGIMEGRDMG